MARFVWIDNEEDYKKFVREGDFDHDSVGFIYDTTEDEIICDFGEWGEYGIQVAGTAPSDIYLNIMVNALNEHVFKEDSL